MSTPKDTHNRLLALAQLIPLRPASVTTTALFEKLAARGYQVNARTVQRDLERLSQTLPLICDEDTKPYRWSLSTNVNLNSMDTPSALALHLIETHLRNHLPQSVTDFTLRKHSETAELIADIHPQQAWLLSEPPLNLQRQLTPPPTATGINCTPPYHSIKKPCGGFLG